MTVSIVATAYSMRYGRANTDDVAFGTDALAGVAGLDCNGVGGRRESVADNAGDGGTATLGDGATMAPDRVESFRGDNGVALSGVCVASKFGEGPAKSTDTVLSLPLSTVIAFGSRCSRPDKPSRNSYRIGENLTATLGFLWPGNLAIGGRVKLAREYM